MSRITRPTSSPYAISMPWMPSRVTIGSLLATPVNVAHVLEREMHFVIHDWMEMVEKQGDLMHIPLNFDERTGHLPQLLRDVIARLRLDVCTEALSPPRQIITGICGGNKGIRWL